MALPPPPRLPNPQAHIQKWKLTCKRLRAPLPMGEGGGLGGAGLMTPMSRRNVPSMFQVGSEPLLGSPPDAQPCLLQRGYVSTFFP